MISDGKLSLIMPIKHSSGDWETIRIEQDGPIAYVESTTLGIREIFDEDRTRFIILASNEGQNQTAAVIKQLAQSASTPFDPDTTDSVIALHHTAHRLLEPASVLVPFAHQLTDSLPKDRLEVRRTFGHLLSLIKAVALRNSCLGYHILRDAFGLYKPFQLKAPPLPEPLIPIENSRMSVMPQKLNYTPPNHTPKTSIKNQNNLLTSARSRDII